jgi:hypothetical protein
MILPEPCRNGNPGNRETPKDYFAAALAIFTSIASARLSKQNSEESISPNFFQWSPNAIFVDSIMGQTIVIAEDVTSI